MKVQIETGDGVVDSHIFYPQGEGPFPAVILYMDGVGIRPQLLAMGERFAESGYATLVPNLFYRAGPALPVDLAVVFKPGPANARMMSLVKSLTGEQVMRDTRAFLDFLNREPKVKGPDVGTVGYCMGGCMSLRAAGTYPDRIVAAATIHSAGLATDRPDSPHLQAAKVRGKIYVAVAGTDPWLLEGESQTLKQTFDAAGVRYQMEDYPDATHGFAIPGNPVYDRAASERVWQRVLALFRETLRANPQLNEQI
jgi:carboxymethylenebutenolidase